MSNVIDLDAHRPHDVQEMACACGRTWVSVYPTGTPRLECPSCGAMVPTNESAVQNG